MAGTALVLGGLGGVGYVVLILALSAAGLPLGFALFGRVHAAGWLTGLLLGYAATTGTVWAVVYSGFASLPLFIAAWLLQAFALAAAARVLGGPLVALPPWGRRDSAALLFLLLLAPALQVGPFRNLGAADADGSRQYRAYFIADFVWHTALTAELAKQAPRPVNPFLSPEPLHYYWTYFRLPASVAAETRSDIQQTLKLNALLTGLGLLTAIYLAAWSTLPHRPWFVAAAVALTVVAPSIEGVAAIADVVRRGLPLTELRDVNIDAAAAWAFKGLRIDNLPRTMWYTPQHGFACALGLLAVPVAIYGGFGASPTAILLAGCALGASVAFNPLLGAVFCAAYGITIVLDLWGRDGTIRDLMRHALAVVPVAFALAWCQVNAVGEGVGDALHLGFWGLARNRTVLTFLLQFGPLLVPMALGLLPRLGVWRTPLRPAVAGVGLAVLVMHFVALTVDPAWVGFRGGNLFFSFAPALVAAPLARLWDRGHRRFATGVIMAVLVMGLPTTLLDAFNAQDVANRGLSRDAERVRGATVPFDPDAEFHWTMRITEGEQEALTWIRTNTAPDAVVQFEATSRGRETWGVIPAFGERRMATGNALPLLARSVYGERNARVRAMFSSDSAERAWREGKALGIDYIFEGPIERAAFPQAVFERAPEYFTPVFRNTQAVVYALRP